MNAKVKQRPCIKITITQLPLCQTVMIRSIIYRQFFFFAVYNLFFATLLKQSNKSFIKISFFRLWDRLRFDSHVLPSISLILFLLWPHLVTSGCLPELNHNPQPLTTDFTLRECVCVLCVTPPGTTPFSLRCADVLLCLPGARENAVRPRKVRFTLNTE